MRIYIKARPNAKETRIREVDETHFDIWVKEPPKDGKANQAVIRVLAEYFNIASSRARIIFGFASKQKICEIE